MLLNNIRIAIRHLNRQKIHTAFHLAGLTLGMSACLLIGLFLRHELSFDGYHAKADRIYRINSAWTDVGVTDYYFSTPMPLAEALRTEVPGLEHIAKVHPVQEPVIEINPYTRFVQDHVMLAEPEFLDIFDVDVIAGNAYEALRQPYQALLTETTGQKFFGRENPIGKTFKYNTDFTITVAGLIRDLPSNTHLRASMILSYPMEEKFLGTDPKTWTNVSGTSTFIVLPENADTADLNSRLKILCDKYVNSTPDFPEGFSQGFDIQPLKDIHFNAKYSGSAWVKAVNTTWLWFFGFIGLAILLVACINFVNLSTAQALTRAKEIGVRKSVGAGMRQLMTQFMIETCVLTFFAGALALAITQLSLPTLNALVDKDIAFDLLHSPGLVVSLFGGIVITSLLAGLYPSWVISKYEPVTTLKSGSSAGDQRTAILRKALVVTQFTIGVGLMISLFLISKQLQYLRSKGLGFDKDNIITVSIPDDRMIPVFTSALSKITSIKNYTFGSSAPSGDHWGTIMSLIDGDDPSRQHVTMILADDHYCDVYGLQLLAGRALHISDTNTTSESLPRDQQIPRAVVNKKLTETLGFTSPEAALGKRFWLGINDYRPEIVGVVRDFNTTSLHQEIEPTVIFQFPQVYSMAGIQIAAGSDVRKIIAEIETAWKELFPTQVFEFAFLDQDIDAYYRTEARLYHLFKIFAGLAMLISCLGLWGLATFSAEQRRKEIGIRKVLGASAEGIVALLSRDFLKLVGIAIVLSIPLSWYAMHQWLQDFAYRIDIGWQVFVFAGLLAVSIAFLTVSFQSIRAAISNPVKSLRSE